MENHQSSEPSRSEITDAWCAGVRARLDGADRANNPFVGKDPLLAGKWDAGWSEGSFRK
jgi:hypothetical protein